MNPSDDNTFPMKAVVRLTGLSPDVLRAWERRYGVVEPERTPGGTRRYTSTDIERLQMLKAVVDAGHRIGDVAQLSNAELVERLAADRAAESDRLVEIVDALDRLDAARAEHLMSLALSALGPVRFAREYAIPLLGEIGHAWQTARFCVASEHLGSGILRSLLGTALRPTRANLHAPPILFATPAGERHELGLLIAALTALGAGGQPVYLGPDLPAREITDAAERIAAAAVALSVVSLDLRSAGREIDAIRSVLHPEVPVWVGGANANKIAFASGVVYLPSLDELERRVELLGFRPGGR